MLKLRIKIVCLQESCRLGFGFGVSEFVFIYYALVDLMIHKKHAALLLLTEHGV